MSNRKLLFKGLLNQLRIRNQSNLVMKAELHLSIPHQLQLLAQLQLHLSVLLQHPSLINLN